MYIKSMVLFNKNSFRYKTQLLLTRKYTYTTLFLKDGIILGVTSIISPSVLMSKVQFNSG